MTVHFRDRIRQPTITEWIEPDRVPTTLALFPRPGFNLDAELAVVALTRILSRYIVSRNGSGGFLTEPAAVGARAVVYRLAGVCEWDERHDLDACRRLKLWFWRVREREAEPEEG